MRCPVTLLQERALPKEVSGQAYKVLAVEGSVGDSLAAMRAMATILRSAQVRNHTCPELILVGAHPSKLLSRPEHLIGKLEQQTMHV